MSRRIAVLLGGHSAEREVSLQSGQTVADALVAAGYDVIAVDPVQPDWQARLDDVDEVFIALHGPGGEDGAMQGLLQLRGLPYSGSGVLGSALAMDKLRAKQLWQGLGIATPRFVSLDQHSDWQGIVSEFGRVFVKPITQGSSVGMSLADDAQNLREAWECARQHSEQVLAEQYVTGPEYTVAVLGDSALPAIRVETDHQFYDYEAKYLSDSTRYVCPCGLSADEEKALAELSLTAFAALGCSVWGRADVMRDERTGEFLVLELNTVPGMTSHSLVPKAARQIGMELPELVDRIMCLSRELSR
ncbi:MAG: D-alanine--D-alanine ligase [Gammaproteobacteria bacterium]|nr:MAG: D-alanine--D-alanine ligase [Gammaproteobacteria bacterium]